MGKNFMPEVGLNYIITSSTIKSGDEMKNLSLQNSAINVTTLEERIGHESRLGSRNYALSVSASFCSSSAFLLLPGRSKAAGNVVVHHADGLHESVADGGAYEAEAALFKVTGHCLGLRCRGWHVFERD